MTEYADLVITGADVYPVDAARSWSDAVAVRGDRIVAVGSEPVSELIGPRTRVIEAAGGMVLPGFQDAHIHAPFAGRNRLRVWLNDLAGRPAYLDRIARYAADNPDQPWIIGGGWAMEHFPGGTPRKEDLDAIAPDRPVFLFNRDVHGAWVNSRALEIAGITRETPDPADGRIERDPDTGEPTGTLHEGAAYSFNDRHVPLPGRAEWEEAILNAQAHLHSLGITGWQDAWVTPGTLEAYRSLAASGRLTARVVGALWWDRHRGLDQIPEFRTQRESAAGGSFHPTTVKIMTDGVLENYTGALLEPYCDGCGGHTDNHGLTYVDAELLAAAVTELDRLDFQVHLHAIGDRAVRNALDAVAAARAANGRRDNRHHIAHLQLVHPQDVPRFRQLGVTANCQAYWAQMEPQMEELTVPFLGRERAQLQYPFGDLLRSGATLAMGSDWSVTTANPLEEIEVAVTRIDPEHRDNAPFLPEQALPLSVALAAFTAGSAYVNHDADGGTIAVGKRADLAVLDRNLFATGAGLPADARVTHTIAGGAVVYDSGLSR
ncbi:amidohydrolase [Micromonospora sp. DR5-3]|uniref:amidohydrolase n=1 Tax=unclassified Micromonospora TaxID=2617518 RepID=UPI0011D7D9B8|nr:MULTISPECIES: amidohydrolase [unclassified Micromonospora]MCW3814058.1 amidohydrolase [Micromonospora sp. DR5-3]TYC23593.1 amidohydrolase [Micromonospora sp. MP36]